MSTTIDRKAGVELAGQAIKAHLSGDLTGALALAVRGLAEFPGLEVTDSKRRVGKPFELLHARLTATLANQATGADFIQATVLAAPKVPVAQGVTMIDVTAAIRNKVESIGTAVPATTPDREAPGAGDAFGEPYNTITIHHSAAGGTRTSGTFKGDGTWPVMNRKGQHWSYSHSRGQRAGFYYLGATKGKTADAESIGWTALALRRAGYPVVIEIDDSGCAPLKVTPDRRSRRLDRKHAALRQERVEQVMGADEPVSAPPAIGTPEAPATTPTVLAAPEAAPVQELPAVPAPVTDVSAPLAPATDAELEAFYAEQTDEALLIMVASREPGALVAARTRFAELRSAVDTRNARPDTAPVVKVVQVAKAPAAARVRPVSAPPAPAVEVATEILDVESKLVVWIQATRATKATRRAINQKLMYMVTNRLGTKDNRPSTTVYTVKSANKFKVEVTIPAGVDRLIVAAKVTEIATSRVEGLEGVTTPAADKVDANA